MKSLVTIAFVMFATACGGEKQAEGGKAAPNAALATPAAVLAAAEARTTAMCACADQDCRLAVSSRPDDPFGEKARQVRDGFAPDQRTQWNDVMKRWAECAMRK